MTFNRLVLGVRSITMIVFGLMNQKNSSQNEFDY